MKAMLTYHSVDDSGSPISISPEAFAAHLDWLTSGRVRVLSLDEIIAEADESADAVAITFDDGFLNAREGLERLLRRGLPATVLVVSGHVGGTNAWGGRPQAGIPTLPLLGWDDLESLVDLGATIGSHTRTHPALTQLSGEALEDELEGSRRELEARFGAGVVHFAYPYGDVNDAVATQASKHYRFGYTTDFRLLSAADNPLRLPRLDMYYFQHRVSLDGWGRPEFRRRIKWVSLRRRVRARLVGGAAPGRGGETAGDTA